jgi:hypothetical protein
MSIEFLVSIASIVVILGLSGFIWLKRDEFDATIQQLRYQNKLSLGTSKQTNTIMAEILGNALIRADQPYTVERLKQQLRTLNQELKDTILSDARLKFAVTVFEVLPTGRFKILMTDPDLPEPTCTRIEKTLQWALAPQFIGMAGSCIVNRQTQIINDLSDEQERARVRWEQIGPENERSAICIPIPVIDPELEKKDRDLNHRVATAELSARYCGVLTVTSTQENSFNPANIKILEEMIAPKFANIIRLHRLVQRLNTMPPLPPTVKDTQVARQALCAETHAVIHTKVMSKLANHQAKDRGEMSLAQMQAANRALDDELVALEADLVKNQCE